MQISLMRTHSDLVYETVIMMDAREALRRELYLGRIRLQEHELRRIDQVLNPSLESEHRKADQPREEASSRPKQDDQPSKEKAEV